MVICTNRDVEIREDTNSFLRLWQEVGTMYRKKKSFIFPQTRSKVQLEKQLHDFKTAEHMNFAWDNA